MSKKGKRAMPTFIGIILALGAVLCLAGCAGKTYRVDYCGAKDFYEGAKDSYRAGKEVTLYYTLIATDTNYSFYLDGEPIHYEYDDQKGFVIRFTMPDHDVKLDYSAQNSMVYVPPHWEGEADVMLLSCYRASAATEGGGEYHELVITTTEDPEEVRLDEYIQEEGREELQNTFYIPYEAAEEILSLIDEYDLSEWNDLEDGVSLDGAVKVCKFRSGEEYIRASSDCMPGDGEEKLDTLFELVKSYAGDASEE